MGNVSSSNGLDKLVPKLRFTEFSDEWQTVKLGEIGTFAKGASLSKADISDKGTPFILYGELYTTYNEVTYKIYRKTEKTASEIHYSKIGDVIIPTSGETPEEIATATCVMLPGVILAGDLNIYRTNLIDGRIVSFIINHVINDKIAKVAQGKSVVHVKAEEIGKIPINYPNAKEQKKILSFLELLDKKIDKQKQLVESLKLYKRGALSKLFPRKGENAPQCRFAGFTEPWEQYKLGELLQTIPLKPFLKEPEPNGTHEVIQQGSEPIIGFANGAPCSEYKDVVIFGDHTLSLYKPKHPFFVATDGVRIVKGKQDTDGYYLLSLLEKYRPQSEGYKRYYSILTDACCVTTYNAEEQKQMGLFFANLDHLITLHQRKLNEFETVKAGLLQQLFI